VRGNIVAFCYDRTALAAGAEVLPGIETEAADVAESARPPAAGLLSIAYVARSTPIKDRR
jgi:hypothetical protein